MNVFANYALQLLGKDKTVLQYMDCKTVLLFIINSKTRQSIHPSLTNE